MWLTFEYSEDLTEPLMQFCELFYLAVLYIQHPSCNARLCCVPAAKQPYQTPSHGFPRIEPWSPRNNFRTPDWPLSIVLLDVTDPLMQSCELFYLTVLYIQHPSCNARLCCVPAARQPHQTPPPPNRGRHIPRSHRNYPSGSSQQLRHPATGLLWVSIHY